MFDAILTKAYFDGIQKIYRFGNNYGARIIKSNCDYKNKCWHLQLIKFESNAPGDWELVSNKTIFNIQEKDLNSYFIEISSIVIKMKPYRFAFNNKKN